MNLGNLLIPAVAVLALAAGCASPRSDLANSTRTGRIYDVKIGETVSPKEIQVRQGDEIRWINRRQGAVRVIFRETLEDRLSCANNVVFSSPTPREYETKIDANQYASLCLSTPGTYRYTARMESTAPGGEVVETALVRVE